MDATDAFAGELLPVWKALADPTRRRILDLLREAPRTTGDLAERFELTRFGVMKHLRVLVEARLVRVRREGRLRWNELNPMPIHEIARRWIRPFEAVAADRLMRLRRHAESRGEGTMGKDATYRSLDIRLEVEIAAEREHVWESLTEGIAEWWPATFYVGRSPKRFVVEPRVGGRVFEDWGDGEGLLFGVVNVFEKERLLQWTGDLSIDFGGPARSVTTFRLEDGETAGTTVLSFRDTPFGSLGDNTAKELDEGWRHLLTGCFQPYAEKGVRPERPASVVGA